MEYKTINNLKMRCVPNNPNSTLKLDTMHVAIIMKTVYPKLHIL